MILTVVQKKKKKDNASAGNRTRVNCLEGSYAHHYTTDAFLLGLYYRSLHMMYIRKGHHQTKSHCRDQDSNLGYCGHNAGS